VLFSLPLEVRLYRIIGPVKYTQRSFEMEAGIRGGGGVSGTVILRCMGGKNSRVRLPLTGKSC
jgi:hypothetical protein